MKKRKKPHKNCRRNQSLLFRTRHHLGRQGVALAGTRQLRSQGLVPVHAHRTKGVTGSERQEGSNGVGSGIRVGGENWDGAGTGKGVEANEGAQDGNGDGSGAAAEAGTGRERGRGRAWRALDEHRMGTGTRAGMETRAVVEMGIGTRMGTGTRI